MLARAQSDEAADATPEVSLITGSVLTPAN